MGPAWIDPCNGAFAHELVKGKCPLEIVRQNGIVSGGRRTATVVGLLPTALHGTITNADLAYLNSRDHDTDHAFDYEGSDPTQLMDGVETGVADGGLVMTQLARRIPRAADADARSLLQSTLNAVSELLKAKVISKTPGDINGNLLRVWVMSCKRVKSIAGPVVVIDNSSMSFSDFADDSTKKARMTIERLTSEQLFDMAIYQWTLMVHALGVMYLEISSLFVFDVAFILRVRHKENFWVCQEYFIACLDLLDRKVVTDVSKIPNHDRGVMLADAKRFGDKFEAAFKGPGGGGAQGPGGQGPGDGPRKEKPPWNHRCQHATSKAGFCPYFNKGKDHDNPKHLDSTGKCIFRHLCNHWVNDKGKGGRCESADHAGRDCDNPNKVDAPLE